MFTHLFIGTNDPEKSRAFYDAVMGALGRGKGTVIKDGNGTAYSGDGASFVVARPGNGEPATAANGGTIGLAAPTPEAVDAAHAAGIAAGGTSDGEPGPREAFPGCYGAYLRDPDGNKLCLWNRGQ